MGKRPFLLHSCCAPCEGGRFWKRFLLQGLRRRFSFTTLIIHPKGEYEIRKGEDKKFCEKIGGKHIDSDYDTNNWFKRVKGLEWEPERGARCSVCFDTRFERTALYAHENGYKLFSSSLGISRWKNMEQINGCGERAASKYEGLTYWTYNCKAGGSQRMIEISKREAFYQQEYGGACTPCVTPISGGWRGQGES